jgi:protein-tyrosine phosphatase
MQTVLFVCSGNYYRSRFAEAYFNHQAAAAGHACRAESRGFRLHPANHGPISPHALSGLARLGISLPEPLRFPATLTAAELQAAPLVVAVKEAEHRPMMQAYFPEFVERVEYWHIDDVDCADPRDALEVLRLRVDELLARLTRPDRGDA